VTRVYLAWGNNSHRTLAAHADKAPVDLLVAFPWLKAFEKKRKYYNIGKLALDSGAFSAWNTGKTINLADYSSACKSTQCDEIFGLDVVWNPQATQRNLETQWADGIDAIPCFHGGSDWKWLEWAAQRPKIAVSSRLPRKLDWLVEVFKRVHPKRVHGFAFTSKAAMNRVPFDSTDSTSWCYSPNAMGNWCGYTGSQIRIGARKVYDYQIEIEEHQRRSRYAAARWRQALQDIRCNAKDPKHE
jgi:hypothetical protein